MPEIELKAFFNCSKELRDAALSMSPEDVKSHSIEILELAQINELVEGEKLSLEIDADGVAHIPIQGMLTNHVSPSAGFFGESITTFEFLSEAIFQANETEAIQGIVFEINSGGGEVEGLEATANAIFSTTKPTTARIHGMAASAAFWLASQADKIIATGRTSSVGSIGVAAEFIDRSAQDKSEGIKRVILTSTDAPEKRLDIKTAEGQKQTINRLDEIHNVFVDHIVRGISPRNSVVNAEFVNKNFGKGSVMAADAALKVGMIDEIEGISVTIAKSDSKKITTSIVTLGNTGTVIGENINLLEQTKEENMELSEFLAQNPTAKSEYDAAIVSAKFQGQAELKTELKAVSGKVLPIVKSGEYMDRVTEAGFEAMSGERPLASFLDFVALSDQINQKEKSDSVQGNQPKPTPSNSGPTAEASAVAEMKKGAKETAKAIGA